MPAYKYTLKNGKTMWYACFYYIEWTGQKKHACKCGFKTQKETRAYEEFSLSRQKVRNYIPSPGLSTLHGGHGTPPEADHHGEHGTHNQPEGAALFQGPEGLRHRHGQGAQIAECHDGHGGRVREALQRYLPTLRPQPSVRHIELCHEALRPALQSMPCGRAGLTR